jgi:hypothetical protein
VPGGPPTHPPKVLPHGVIGLVGWANRLLVVLYCAWAITVARQAMKLPDTPNQLPGRGQVQGAVRLPI